MAASNKVKRAIGSSDEALVSEDTSLETAQAVLYDIPISEIDEFPDHPFRVELDPDMYKLIESIKERGVITPAIVRRKADGRYELISGHRRRFACEKLFLPTLKCRVVDVSNDDATIMMVECNSQRTFTFPCDKGKAYKMKLEAEKRKQEEARLDPNAPADGIRSSRDRLAGALKVASEQIRRYIRLTYLIPELQSVVDEGKLNIRSAVELSYLDEKAQGYVAGCINEKSTYPSHAQSVQMRKVFEAGELTEDSVSKIMSEANSSKKAQIRIPYEKARSFLPEDFSEETSEEYVLRALEYYQRYLNKRQRDKER